MREPFPRRETLPAVDGQIIYRRVNGEDTWDWQGGDVVLVDQEMVEERHGQRPLGPRRQLPAGAILRVGPYTLSVLGLDFACLAYVCRRERGRERER